MGRGTWSPTPREASPTLGEAGADSHRGPEQKGGHGEEGAAGRSPTVTLLPEHGGKCECKRGEACAGRRERPGMAGEGLSTVPSDGCCVELGGPCTALERGGAGICLVRSVSEGCPGPSFQEGCAPLEPPSLPACLCFWRKATFLSSMLDHHLTVPRIPRGEEEKSKANQIQLLSNH